MADLIADLDALSSGLRTPPPKTCAVGFVLSQLSEAERNKLQAVVDANIVPATRIADVLRKNGYSVHYASVTRHRRRKSGHAGCTCP